MGLNWDLFHMAMGAMVGARLRAGTMGLNEAARRTWRAEGHRLAFLEGIWLGVTHR